MISCRAVRPIVFQSTTTHIYFMDLFIFSTLHFAVKRLK
nr:MAG TPA: hypothetical protein [Caudoviricetes sp.]